MNEAKKKIVIGISVVAVLLAAVIALLLGGKKTTDVSNETTSDLYKITILESAHGSVTANKYEAKEGEEIVLTVTPDENYELSSLAVNQKESETTFKMPAEDVRVLAKFALIEGAETAAYEGDTFGSAEGYVTTEGVDLSDDNGENPYISVTAGGPQYAYVKNVYTDQLVFETTFKVNEIFNDDAYPKFGIMLNGTTEMVKFFVDLRPDMTCESVGVVHQPTGGEDDWANAYSKSIEKLNLADQEITLKVVRDRQDYYFYVNNVMVLCEKGALCSENTAVGIFSFNTGLEAFEYRHLEDDMAKAEIAQAKSDSYPMMGDFFGKSGRFYSSDVIDFSTDHGEMPYLVLDAYKGTPLYTYINNFSSKQYYFEIDATVTAIRDDEEFPKFGIITRNEKEMVKFYFDMSREKLVPQIGIVRQLEGGKDDWDNQDIALLPKTLNLGEEKVEIGVLRNGTAYYVYVNDELIINGNDLSSQEEAAGFFTFGTSLIINNYKLIESGEQFDALLQKARKDTKGLYDFRLSQNYFDEKENGVYVLKTDSADESKVDDVMYYSQIFRESYYSVSGKITLSNAENWGQSRILISSDPQNEHVIALEKTGKDTYQIFAMSKDGENTWNDWRLISSAGLNGDRNSLDFEVIVARDKVYFLIDDEICYTSDRVSMEESTVKFSGYKKATTTVENLDGKRFKNGEELNEYLKTKDYADYETERGARINELYKEYFVTNNCAGKGGTLLLGNSHIDFWEDWETQSGLTNYVNGYNVGIDLSTTSDWLYAYDKLVKPFGAERYVICIGENDATNWGLSGSEIVSNLKTLFEKIHKDFPNAEIYYIYQFPSPANYAKGKFTNEKLAELAKAEKQLCSSLSYVTGMDAFDLLVTKDKKSSNKNLFRDTDKLHLNEAGYQVWSDYLYDEIFKGETFGVTKGDGVTYKTTNGIELINDKGNASTVEIFGKAPRYAYVNDTYTEKVYFETEVSLTELLTDEYPKFGLMVNGKTEMVKFYLDVNKDAKEVTQVGVVKQPTGGEDDWTNQKTFVLDNKVTLKTDKVKLALLRDGKDYYFYVDGELAATGSDLKAENGAVGVFSFNCVMTLDKYSVVKTGTKYNDLLGNAKADGKNFAETYGVTQNYFTEISEGVYTLTTTTADGEGKVDDVKLAGAVVKEANYSISGKLTLESADAWGQSRILVSSDAKNEYMIALEKKDDGAYQLFITSKSKEDGWNWEVRKFLTTPNALTNSINFEVITIGNKIYFAVDGAICHVDTRVSMTESTVKFAGYNQATTTVENLAGQVFESAAVAENYVKESFFIGDTFGSVTGKNVTYETTECVDLSKDNGNSPTIKLFGISPRYAYLKDTYTKQFYFETEAELTSLLPDEWPKFGLMVNGQTEMVKFYLDVNKDSKKVTQIGVVHQLTGLGDDWAGQKVELLDTPLDLSQNKVTLGLLRDGKKYYLYVDGTLVAAGNDLTDEDGVVGAFSFNSVVTLGKFKVVQAGDDYQTLLGKAVEDAKVLEGFKLTTNHFEEASKGVYKLTTDSDNEGTVDDVNYGGETFKEKYYSVKGKLTLTDAKDWGQSRILISADAKYEHFIALEKTNAGKYQIFTMSKNDQQDWGNWTEILHADVNGTRNSINFEVIVDQSKVYFLIDDVFCYASDRVSMPTSTVKFAGYNHATTTVENLEGTVFKNSQAVQDYLATKSGENFGKAEGDGATYQTVGTDLSKDYGSNPTIRMSNAANYNAYLKNIFTDKFYFKTEFNVSSVRDGEDYPKFGIQIHSEEEQVRFYVDMSTSLTSNTVGVVHNDDWTNRNVTANVAGMTFTGNDKVTLEVIRDGNAYFFYVNGNLALYDGNGLADANSAVGIFGFGTESTASGYELLVDDAANNKIATAVQAVNFFDSATVDLSKDYGAKIGTVNVNTGNTEFIYVKNYFEKDFYFETKVHVNEIYHSENWPKFGVFAENENCSTREIFYVDMATDKTSSIVGRKTNDWNNNWSDSTSATVAGMNFAGDGEYVTLGLQKVDGCFFFYVNGEYVLKFDSAITGNAKVGVFGFNTGMELKEYFVSEAKTVGKMIASNNEAGIDIVEIGKKIWTNKDYVFTSLPEAFIGKEFVKASYGESGKTVDVTVQKPGYIYVLTNAYKMNNSQAETLDDLNYTKLDMANWKFCSFTTTTSYIWVYEKYVEAGEKLQLGQWSVVIASEERLNLDSDTYKVSDANMAVLKPGTSATVGNMELGVKAFADKPYTFSDMPYWLAGKNYILGKYGDGSATATCGGVVYMLTNTGDSGRRVQYFENKGYIQVNVPKFTAFTGGNFDTYDFVVYKKTVAEDENVTWPSWAIPIFSGDLVLSDNLAKIEADGTTTQAAQYEQNVRLFDNRTYYASGDKLEALHGKSYLLSGFEEGATGTVTKAGTVYVQIPTKTTNSTYVQLEADLIAAGYTPAPYRLYRNNKGVPGKNLGYAQKLYQKEVAVDDIIHFGQYNLVYFDTLNTEEYYEMPSVTTAAKIYNNPKTTGIQNALYTYDPDDRNWQGCPVVTITDGPNGKRMWAAWFTGGATELNTGNFAVLLYSDDNGKTWVDPAVAIVHPDTAAQVTKPQLWTLDDGRLWVSWSQHTGTGGFDGKMGTWAAICENPGAPIDQLKWSEPKRLFDGRGNGKVTVLNKGQTNEEWLTTAFDWIDRNYSKVYSSTDKGGTWTFKGKAEVTGSTYNNAILTELKDGTLWMLLRQLEGNMKESFSYDGGVTWTNATTSHIEHPNSAIYVGWTSSGKLLMINHKDFTGRNNLTAFLSEDGGKTWPHTLLLDARSGVSYPDVIEDNGTFYVVYDYDRFNTGQMYMAKITEADIIAGELTTSGSYLKHRFSDMGIHGPQVSDEALKIDLSDADVSASTEGSPAQNAFDGNTDTRWCATSVDMPQWLMIDLKDVYNLESVYVFFEQKSDWNYKIETSVDGTTWDEYANPGSQRIIDVTITKDAAARYVRLTVNGTTDGAWASVWEMEIYGNKAQSSYSLRPSQPVADQTLSGNSIGEEQTVSGNSLSENEKSDSQDTVSGNEIDDLPETVSGNHVGD